MSIQTQTFNYTFTESSPDIYKAINKLSNQYTQGVTLSSDSMWSINLKAD